MDKEVNERIRQIRKDKGYTQEEIATLLGMKRNAYSQAEKVGNFDTLKIKKLAEFLNVDVKFLLYGETPKPEAETAQTLQEILQLVTKLSNTSINQPKEPEICIGYKCSNITLSVMEMNIIEIIRGLNKEDLEEVNELLIKKFRKQK